MSATQSSLARTLKANTTIRWLSNTTLVEVVAESLNMRLPLSYRIMRLLSRSNHLRNAAIRFHSRRRREPLNTTTETVFGGLEVNDTVRALEEKGFVVGFLLTRDMVAKI